MKSDKYEQIRQNVDLKQYIQKQGVVIQNDNKFLCPSHEDKNPSAHLYEKEAVSTWHCFACNVGGDVIDYASKHHNWTKSETVKKLGINYLSKPVQYNYGQDLTKKIAQLKSNLRAKVKSEGMEFLKDIFPKITPNNESILQFLGWDTYHESLAIIVNDKTIKTHKIKTMTGKWITSKGSSSTNLFPLALFNNSDKKRIVISEGEKDVLNCHLNGIYAITLGSAGGDWSKHKEILKDCSEIILAFDHDTAGEKGRDKTINALKPLNILLKVIDFSKLNPPVKDKYDVSDFLEEFDPSAMFSSEICSEIKLDEIAKTEFEAELELLNINPHFDVDKKHYLILESKTKKILHSGNKHQIHQILSSKLKRPIKINEYSEFPLCFSFYDPERIIPFTTSDILPINVYQKLEFKTSSESLNSIPPTISILLSNIFQDQKHIDYFINWIACFLKTGRKSQVSIVLISGQGIGKGTLTRVIENLFGLENCV